MISSPGPEPAYELSPDLGALSDDQRRALNAVGDYLDGRVGEATVVRVVTTDEHHVFELETALGPLLVLERA